MAATTADRLAASPEQQPQIVLLGSFAIRVGGQSLDLPGRKARAILAYLVLSPERAASRGILASLLWTDRGAEQARGSLRHALMELRDLPRFSDALDMGRDSIALTEGRVTSDLEQIRQAAARRDLPRLADALDLVQGEPLEDLIDLSPGFDEWLATERTRLRDQLIGDVLDALGEVDVSDMKHARKILRSLDRLDPANEEAVRLGMQLDHMAGDASSLHRRYRELQRCLKAEFDVRPSRQTRALFDSLTGAEPHSTDADATGTASAPASPGRLIGKSDLLPLVLVSSSRSADGELESFASACAVDICTEIQRLQSVEVIHLAHEPATRTLAEAENALAIYSLSLGVSKLGEQMRASLQLADAATQIIVWAEKLRVEQADFDTLDTLVEKACGAVLSAIDRDLQQKLASAEEGGESDRDRFTRARLLIRQAGDLESVRRAVDLLEGLVESDPRHVGARLLLVRMYNTDFWQQLCGHDVQAFRAKAEEHLAAVARLHPEQSELHLRKGWCELRKGNLDLARREFMVALESLPRDADTVNMCAFGFCHLGEFELAEDLMQRAFRLNPFPPSDYHADYAVIAALRGEARAAEDHFIVSGEIGLQYTAVRLANATRLNGHMKDLVPVAESFASAFRKAWQRSEAPTLDDVDEWLDATLPLFPLENRNFVKNGLREMLRPCW
ncbi:BTAD domain-containing putative transcriptional regulator [Aurantiacibacter hainanensis]|uniref:BTAD domain-containing putative transcriptional regulator n=1 Tax=Aurantiacibacter hainanensis TaxID=3076114 RepID=UPI0030C753F8